MNLPILPISKLFFWMMEVYVDGTFFRFTGGSRLVTWPELTLFLMLKREIGNSGFLEEDFAGNGLLNGWVRDWLNSSSRKEIFLIADLKKFYRVSNSVEFNCRTEEILSSLLPWNRYAMNTKIMNAERKARWIFPLQDSS